jgi:hypothetical protein
MIKSYDSTSMTSIQSSLQSHYIAFAAEKSRLSGMIEPVENPE